MSQLVNFSSLQSSSALTSGDQILIRKNNSLSGAQGFARISFTNLEKSTTVYSNVNTLSTQILALSTYWSGNADAFVDNFSELKIAVANPSVKTIILGADIYFDNSVTDYTIPRRCSINFNGYKFIRNSASVRLFMQGEVLAGRVQIFDNWSAGDILGTFRNDALFPEWWGLQGSNVDDGRHDIAINCAIRTANSSFSIGRTISFAAGDYYVGRPLDGTNLAIRFKGAGSGATRIHASKLWTSFTWKSTTRFRYWNDFIKYQGTTFFTSAGPVANGVRFLTTQGGSLDFLSGGKARITNSPRYSGEWTIVGADSTTSFVLSGMSFTGTDGGIASPITADSEMDTVENADAIIWIGGGIPNYWGPTDAYARYWSGVEGMTILGTWAMINNPTKRISGISWVASVEELTLIKDVDIQGFSGMGIGGGMYDEFNNSDPGAVYKQDGGMVNGLSIQNFWIKESGRRGSIPIFLNKNTFSCKVKEGTIDCTTARSVTVSSVNYPYARTWPLIGILLYGGVGTTVENIHLEGMRIGIYVGTNNNGSEMVRISNIDSTRLMDAKMKDADQFLDGDPQFLPQTAPPSIAFQMLNETVGYVNQFKDAAFVPATSGFHPYQLPGGVPGPGIWPIQVQYRGLGSYLFRYSALIALGTTFEGEALYGAMNYPNNYMTCLDVRNVATYAQYIIRDLPYGQDIATIPNKGRFPTVGYFSIASYTRGITFGLPVGNSAGPVFNEYPNGAWNKTWTEGVKPLSAWDKTYYQLIY